MLEKCDNFAVFNRVMLIFKESKIEKKEFLKKHGIEDQYWNNWVKRGLPSDLHYSFAIALGVNTDWLIGGKEPIYRSEGLLVNENNKPYLITAKTEKEKQALRLVNSIVGRLQDDWLADGEKKAELCQDIISSANNSSN